MLANSLLILMMIAGAGLAAERTNDVIPGYQDLPIRDLAPLPDFRDPCDCIQLVFVIDVTGSMSGAINNIKAGLVDILDTAQIESCGNLEAAVVSFRDEVYVDQAMTSDMNAVTAAINGLTAAGGDGWPEASDEALRELVSSANCLASGDFDPASWNTECCRIAVLVTDAPPAGCDDFFAYGTDDVSAAAVANTLGAWGVQVGAVLVSTEGAPDAQAEPIMINYAAQTGGVFASVPADGSGTADAIEIIIRECNGSEETELCCLETGCITVLAGECLELGGYLVDDCNQCDPVSNEDASWGDLKKLYR